MKRPSASTATDFGRALLEKGAREPPGPGPISITVTPSSEPVERAIFRVKLRSKR